MQVYKSLSSCRLLFLNQQHAQSIRILYAGTYKLTPMFASPFFEAKLNLETSDSSLFVDQGSGAFPL